MHPEDDATLADTNPSPENDGVASDSGDNSGTSPGDNSSVEPSNPPAPAPEKDVAPEEGDKKDDGSVDASGNDTMLGKVMKVMGLKKTPAKDGDKTVGAPAKVEAAPEKPEPEKPQIVPAAIAADPSYKKMQSDLAAATESAGRYATLNNFLVQNKIAPDQVGNALSLTALANSNPQEFYIKIKAMTDDLAITLGHALPADLQKEVDDGLIHEARAKEIAKLRVGTRAAEHVATTAIKSGETIAEENASRVRMDVVNAFFSKTAKTDFNLESKVNFIQAEVLRLITEHGSPADARGQVTLLETAYKNVNAGLKNFNPRQPVSPPPRSGTAPAIAAKTSKDPMLNMVQNILNGKPAQ